MFDRTIGFKTSWHSLLSRAAITRLRWHDLRHRFASRLVQRGMPLHTLRDLLGHRTVLVSLRHAHLAPDQRREAVDKLNEKPILALTVGRVYDAMRVSLCKNGGKGGNRTLDPGIESGRSVDHTLAINHLPRASVAEHPR